MLVNDLSGDGICDAPESSSFEDLGSIVASSLTRAAWRLRLSHFIGTLGTLVSARLVCGRLRPEMGLASWPAERLTLVADPAKVERVFTTSLSALLEGRALLEERWRRERRLGADEEYLPIYFYRVPGDVIWVLAVRVLTECLFVGNRHCTTHDKWPECHANGL